MYEDLVKLARHCAEVDACINCPVGGCQGVTGIMNRLADAIEELTGFVLEAERDRDEYRERLDKANDAIEELSKPRWIPVTERLPKKSGYSLTAFGDGTAMAVNEFMHPRDWLTEEGRKANPNGKWYWGGVTHWMPLPEPPKEEA